MSRVALSVRSPWAQLLGAGLKTVEFRTWPTSHRGELHIQQAQRHDSTDAWLEELAGPGLPGHVASRVDVLDCRPATLDDAEAGCVPVDDLRAYMAQADAKGGTVYAWIVANAAKVAPFPLRGACGRLIAC